MALTDTNVETQESPTGRMAPVITDRDIVFNCGHCTGELVVDRDGEGIEVVCPHCGQPLIIPPYGPPTTLEPASTSTGVNAEPGRRFDFTGFSRDQLGRRIEELRHQLKENRSQDTELRGHVNRAQMELHRLQLRLQKLHDRQLEIESEISAARSHGNMD